MEKTKTVEVLERKVNWFPVLLLIWIVVNLIAIFVVIEYPGFTALFLVVNFVGLLVYMLSLDIYREEWVEKTVRVRK